MIERVAKDLGVAVELSKIESRDAIRSLGIKATPAVMVEGQLVHSGGIPSHESVQSWINPGALTLLAHPTRHLFFTGKGGVGKTSLSAAVALSLVDCGKKALLVSTDAASNLDEMLGVPLSNQPLAVPAAPGLTVLNIDPDTAAESYRQRVVDQMAVDASDTERSTVREQLSGACTTEIASFDEFASLLSDRDQAYDHIIFDTAPTGHTLRLLSLPKAWSGFLAGNDRGASCLGPHSGLKMQELRFNAALGALCDAALTTVVLVTRPDIGAIGEAARTSEELSNLGLHNQRLVINGVFHATDKSNDAVANAIETLGAEALNSMPARLRALPQDQVPLRAFDTVGLPALRALLRDGNPPGHAPDPSDVQTHRQGVGLESLADELAQAGQGLIMVMGKGGVGKTTIAAALALGLIQRGKTVHLSTTDPAAHLANTLDGAVEGLRVDRIDPVAATRRYVDRIMASKGAGLGEQERALMLEDLRSPCTEEVAVFHAFSRVVSEGRSAFVVLDTAPTGHSLLLMDATGAYHRQMMREFEGRNAGRVVTPLMRLQDPAYTRIILVTLPEITPVSQAKALQDDLRRAGIEPFAWVINKSVLAAGTHDPLLAARLKGELHQYDRIADGLSRKIFVLPWLARPPIGLQELGKLVASKSGAVDSGHPATAQ